MSFGGRPARPLHKASIKSCRPSADALLMRRAAPVGVALTVAALLLLVGAPAFAAILFAALIGVLVLIGVAVARRVPRWRSRDPLARVSWLVSLVVSAVITVPQLALAHYKHAVA